MPSLTRNTSYFTLALILQKVISLTYFTLYARALGPADLGQYYFAISVTSIFSIFLDFGLGNVVTREIAKFPDKARAIVSSVIAVKIPLTILSLLLIFGWSLSWGYSPIVKELLYISAISMVLDSFTGVFFAVARGFHNLKFESISSVFFQLIVLSLSLVVLKEHWSIPWLMATLATASLCNLIYSFTIIRSVWKISPRPNWNKTLIRQLFTIALPFGLFVIVQRFYTFFDSVLLFKLAGDRAVGLYQVPFKIIIALQFLPMAFVASLYPVLSTYWHKNREKLADAFEQGIKYCLAIAIPVSFGAIAMAEKIVLLFKSEFNEAALLLRVSMIAVPFMFLGFPIGSLLNACDKQKNNTINMAITAATSAILNLILIPKLGVLGACITTVITSILMIGLGWNIARKITPFHGRKVLLMISRIVGAGLVMALFVFCVKNYLHPVLSIISAIGVYALMLFIFGGVTKEDISLVLKSLNQKTDIIDSDMEAETKI